MKVFLLMILPLMWVIAAPAQESPAVSAGADNIMVDVDRASIGLGDGMDFDSYGLNLLVYPQKNIGIFAGAGYALARDLLRRVQVPHACVSHFRDFGLKQGSQSIRASYPVTFLEKKDR